MKKKKVAKILITETKKGLKCEVDGKINSAAHILATEMLYIYEAYQEGVSILAGEKE